MMRALFTGKKIDEYCNAVVGNLEREISLLPKKSFVNSTIDELILGFMQKNTIDIPKLLENKMYTKKPEDVKISLCGRIYNSRTIDGIKFTFVVPFEGHSFFFETSPSRFMDVFPLAEIKDNELLMTFQVPNGRDTSRIKAEADKNLERINTCLGFLEEDLKSFSNRLSTMIKISLKNRKTKLDSTDDSFGFLIR